MRVATQTSSATLMVGLAVADLAIAVVIRNSCGDGRLLACARLRLSLPAFRLGMDISLRWYQSDWELCGASCREFKNVRNPASFRNKTRGKLDIALNCCIDGHDCVLRSQKVITLLLVT